MATRENIERIIALLRAVEQAGYQQARDAFVLVTSETELAYCPIAAMYHYRTGDIPYWFDEDNCEIVQIIGDVKADAGIDLDESPEPFIQSTCTGAPLALETLFQVITVLCDRFRYTYAEIAEFFENALREGNEAQQGNNAR